MRGTKGEDEGGRRGRTKGDEGCTGGETGRTLTNKQENNFKEILTLTPARSETLSSLEISMKFNEHATKSVV